MATGTINRLNGQSVLPREHGASAMLLTPFFSAAILLKQVYWQEVVALIAIVAAFLIKDPLIVLARQYFVWKQQHSETAVARRAAIKQLLLLTTCGIVLLLTGDWRPWVALFLGAGAFTVLTVIVNVGNRQRSEWFQVASAVALSSTSVVAALSGRGNVPAWCWLLWALSALQAAAGIFVVHARLDARVAARRGEAGAGYNRRAALVFQLILLISALVSALFGRLWIAAALALVAIGYLIELRRQSDPASLQMPLKHVGQQALALSILFAVMIIIGLW